MKKGKYEFSFCNYYTRNKMPKYTIKEIKLDELYLDEKNPRFIIPPNPSQESIVDYLIENEEVEQLANDIVKNGGLNAGERVIVTEENGRWVVLEGNRRICACKILLKPSLLVNKRLASLDKIALLVNDKLKRSLSIVNVDVMKNRLEAQSSLAAKHINGIKRWSTISKHKFFALEFDAGKSIKEISIITGMSETKIKTGLKEYRIIDYVLRLPFWSSKEREMYLNLQEIKTTRLTRLFSAKPSKPEGKRLKEIIDLDYDDNYFIKSSLAKDVFDKILYIVAQAAFVPNYASDFYGTRSTYEDIPQLMQFLEENKLIFENTSGEKKVSVGNALQQNSDTEMKNSEATECVENKKTTNVAGNQKLASKRNVLIPEDFSVNCTVAKINDIICELKRLNFGYCINAQAVLLRVLLELSLKYYLNRVNESNKIHEGHLEGTYVSALESMRVKRILDSVEHSNLIQLRKRKFLVFLMGTFIMIQLYRIEMF